MRLVTSLLLAALLLSSPPPAPAQTREKRIIPVDPRQRDGFETRRRAGVAILAGVGRYPRFSGLSELRYRGRDVDTLEKELIAQRYAVITLKDGEATKHSVLNAIAQAGEVLDPDSGVMIFFFSGHGFADGGANYLATVDASATALSQTGLRLNDVETAMTKAGAARRALWVDACRNEPGKSVNDGRSFTQFKQSDGTRILFSTKFGKKSYEDDGLQQGIFSHFLVRGLRGEAGRSDGMISFRDLADFVTDGVENATLRSGHVQVPYEGGEAKGDFLIGRAAAVEAVNPAPAPAPVVASRRPERQPGEKRVNPKDGATYVWIPSGTFQMGCSPGDYECDSKDENPVQVTLTKGFWLGETEVSQGAYQRVTASNPSNFKGADKPVERVTWNEAQAYCKQIGGRLPTEAEWERAARGGTSAARYGDVDSVGWYDKNSGNTTHAVKGKQVNSYGLYDMLGNVWEWTNDWYGEKPPGGTDPMGPSIGQYRVRRGGSWYDNSMSLRTSDRNWGEPTDRDDDFGFRCAWE